MHFLNGDYSLSLPNYDKVPQGQPTNKPTLTEGGDATTAEPVAA